MQTLSQTQLQAALNAADDADVPPQERAEMLMEIAMGLQQRPQSVQQIADACASTNWRSILRRGRCRGPASAPASAPRCRPCPSRTRTERTITSIKR